jgi:hypothetical protein
VAPEYSNHLHLLFPPLRRRLGRVEAVVPPLQNVRLVLLAMLAAEAVQSCWRL